MRRRPFLLLLLGVAAVLVTSISEAIARPGTDRSTTIYNRRGVPMMVLTADGGYGDSGECWVQGWGSGLQRTAIAGLTHSTYGGAVPASNASWKVWAGRHLVGTLFRRNARRVDVYRHGAFTGSQWQWHRFASPRWIAYTIGPAMPDAGTAWLLLRRCA